MRKSKIDFIFTLLKKQFYSQETELIYFNPFQLLVSVILSAQTTDKQVNKVTGFFFDKLKTPQDVVNLWLEKFEKLVSSINFFRNKAKNIFTTASKIIEHFSQEPDSKSFFYNLEKSVFDKYWYWFPADWRDLMGFNWVWEKTAKVIVHILYWIPVVAVDTHVHRVANRLWIVETSTPIQTSALLDKKIPEKYKKIAHHSMIYFGRYFCKAKSPKCVDCPFWWICKFSWKTNI